MSVKRAPKVPEIYDIQLDGFRPVTKKDIDSLYKVCKTYGKLIEAMMQLHVATFPDTRRGRAFKKLLTTHKELS